MDVETVFDGTQILTKLRTSTFDLLIVTEDIPRIPLRQIVSYCNEERIPVLVLTNATPRLATLIDSVLANDYLPFPFTSSELKSKISRICEYLNSSAALHYGDIAVDASGFMIGTRRLTAEEIEILSCLIEGRTSGSELKICIGSINTKLADIGSSQRIRYLKQEGFKLVKT